MVTMLTSGASATVLLHGLSWIGVDLMIAEALL